MNCTVCRNEESNVKALYNDCVIESLEKIKTHYMSFKKQLTENELIIKNLKEVNDKLQKTITEYERNEGNSRKKSRTSSTEDNCSDEIPSSENIREVCADKSIDDFNKALNDEEEFEVTFDFNSSLNNSKNESIQPREPLKIVNDYNANLAHKVKVKDEDEQIPSSGSAGMKKVSSWISKENESKNFFSHTKRSNKSLRHLKQNKAQNMSLKTGRLRQTRLQLDISKNASSADDLTFCDEAIEASPNSDLSLRKNSSKLWTLRNISSKLPNSADETIFDTSIPKVAVKKEIPPNTEDKSKDTSSVIMLTPASQDVIFLDDSCDSINIESMDLLKELMNPSQSRLTNLRRMETDRIKLLQKTTSEKALHPLNKSPESDKNENIKTSLKAEHSFAKPIKKEDNVKNKENQKEIPVEQKLFQEYQVEKKCEPLKSETKVTTADSSTARQRLLNVNCNECQTYIKYLGNNLTDEEIERHIRGCTKHKKRIEISNTPEGFWDPFIKPLADDDPRNITQIDDRFVGKDRQK